MKQINRPIRKATISTPANVNALSRANTSIGGTPKLPGHAVPRNIISAQQTATKGISIV